MHRRIRQFSTTVSIPTTVDAVLQVGELAGTVEVKASVANVQVESATVGRAVEARLIEDATGRLFRAA